MLTIWRIIALLLAVLFAGVAYSKEHPTVESAETKKAPEPEQRGSDKNPFAVKLLPGPDVDTKAAQEKKYRNEKTIQDEKLSNATVALACITGLLAVFTGGLWLATYRLAKDAKITASQQAIDMQASLAIAKQSADATTKAADAAIVASMPVLSPLIVGGILHPFSSLAEKVYPTDQPTKFESSVHFVFENFGKTPGMIREVRGDLFLCEMDQFPTVDFEQLPIIDYQPIVAGDSRGGNALMGVAEYEKMISLVPIEYAELLASADHKYRRFAFIGRVIYDDFFGNRHTRRFCVKTRLMDKGLFQLIRGGRAYNHVERQKIPEDE